MDVEKITANTRTEKGTHRVRRLREKGLIPAIVYGHKVEPKPVSVPKDDLLALLRHGRQMVELQMDDGNERALIKDIQYDAFGDHVIHVDFTRVTMDEKITVTVPVELVGHPVGVTHGGILEHSLKEVEVECLPGDIPDEISVIARELDIDAVVHVKDLPRMPGVIYLNDPNEVVVHILPPVKPVEVEEAAVGEAGAEPEVLTERKEEEGAESKKK
jgi:large subunit ribosomal protein L25